MTPDVVDVASTAAIAGIVWTLIQLFGAGLTPRQKPPAAGALGIAWAVAAFLLIPGAYANVLVAIASGILAAAMASGVESYRATYRSPKSEPPA